MSQVVVISGHPNLETSYTNKVILEQLQQEVEGVQIRRLDTLYPDYKIDVEAEQHALLNADVVILQFPFYWYSVPALLKKWIDDVFSFNFAYGPEGDKLKNKALFLSFTVGGPEEAYTPKGYNHFRIEELVKPLEQTAYLADMSYQAPCYSHRMVYIPGVYNTQEEVESRAQEHAERLIQRVNQLLYSPEKQIEKFVAKWFARLDQLPEEEQGFLTHLAPNVEMLMPEGKFSGHEGFKAWYQVARSTFKPSCQHQLEQLDIAKDEAGYQVQLRIRLIAETHKGDSVNFLVNEQWRLELDESNNILLHHYHVEPAEAA